MLSNLSLPWWAYALMGTGLCVFIALIAITIHRNRGMHRSLFASPYALWMMIFTIVPVILIAYYAFTDSSGAFTLDNFRSFWDSNYESNKIILDAMGEAGQAYISRGTVNVDTLVYSLWMAFQCTVICLLLGYPAALIMADREIKLGPTLVVLFIIPMWMNFLLRTIAWMSLLEDNGLINTVLRALGFNGVQLMYNSGAVLLGINPIYTFLVCVPTRILAGWLCGLSFKGLNKLDKTNLWSFGAAGLIGALCNTVLFMTTLCLCFYNTEYIQGFVAALGSANAFLFVIAFVGENGLVEGVVCLITGAAIAKAVMYSRGKLAARKTNA